MTGYDIWDWSFRALLDSMRDAANAKWTMLIMDSERRISLSVFIGHDLKVVHICEAPFWWYWEHKIRSLIHSTKWSPYPSISTWQNPPFINPSTSELHANCALSFVNSHQPQFDSPPWLIVAIEGGSPNLLSFLSLHPLVYQILILGERPLPAPAKI